MNCVETFAYSAFSQSDKPALIEFDGNNNITTSFRELYKLTLKAQSLLNSYHIKKSDTILLFERPSPCLYALVIAALGMGVKILLIEPWMSGEKITKILNIHNPKMLITNALGKFILLKSQAARNIPLKISSHMINNFSINRREKIHIEAMDVNNTAILTFTSGTTGTPKGVHRKHQFLIDQGNILKKYLQYDLHQKLDLVIFTNIVLINLNLGKGSLILKNPWSVDLLKKLDLQQQKFNVDTLACNPKFLELLTNHTQNISLATVHVGGALADCNTYQNAIQKWPDTLFEHVYGSTEAEPVAVSNLNTAVQKSKEAGFFQTLFLGTPIEEINTKYENSILWVSGKHVSPLYEGDIELNFKNKKTDANGQVWHNMGDRINNEKNDLWYMGRENQLKNDFLLEQKVYIFLQNSSSFLFRNHNNQLILIGENVELHSKKIKKQFPEIEDIIERKIQRDDRHRSRIDRVKTIAMGANMGDIKLFIKERVPLVANLILALGLIFSIQTLLQQSFAIYQVLFLTLSLLLFITELRFMDELKDFEKDKIANPTRPLPSGRISTQLVSKLVTATYILLIICAVTSFFINNYQSAVILSTSLFWLFLMYKEFFIPKIINKSPMVYAITHQIVIVPIVFFVISFLKPEFIWSKQSLAYALIILGSFFTYEVGRKMDPKAHPILRTYLVYYGKIKTHVIIASLLSLTLIGAFLLDKIWWFAPSVILILLTQIKLLITEKKHKDLEGLIALNLIYNIWIIFIQGLVS